MNYPKFLCLLLLPLSGFLYGNPTNDNDRYDYINQYKRIAVLEMERTGIPASIKLAQGILESDAGKSYLATSANNHFGIKCGPAWRGKKIYKKDDDRDNKGQLIESCFRVYKNAQESYIAHSQFLADPNKAFRYGKLFEIDPTDYKAWARGLKDAGYATSPTYASKLIRIIETYDLHKYDLMKSSDLGKDPDLVDIPTTDDDDFLFEEPTPPADKPGTNNEKTNDGKEISYEIKSINEVLVATAVQGETPQDISDRTSISLDRILQYNEGITSPNQKLNAGDLVFLQSKRNSFRGFERFHTVEEGETMYSISQRFGIKLEKLYERNLLPSGTQPAVGEQIRLKGRTKDPKEAPKIREVTQPITTEDKDKDKEEDSFMEEPEVIPNPVEETPPIDKVPLPPVTPPVNPPAKVDPPKPNPPSPQPDTQEKPQEKLPFYHTVETGDTLYSLARRYGTTVEQIKTWNNLPNNTIQLGARLRVQ